MNHIRSRSTIPSILPSAFWFIAAAACWYCAARCHAISSHNREPSASFAAAGCLLAAFIGGLMVLRALNAGDLRRDHKQIDQQRRESATTHGRARFADADDIKRFGLDTGKGTLLGHYKVNRRQGIDLWYNGENSALTIGPPGSGKATCGSILQLLTNAGSMVVNDPKAELYLVTGDYRRDVLGHDVVLICPHHAMLGAELGVSLKDTRYNPCSIVRDGPTIKDDIEMLASVMLPSPGHAHPQAEFFAISGQTWLIAGCLDLKRRNQPLTLPALSAWLKAPPQAFEKQLSEMMKSDALNGLVSEIGGKLLGTLLNAPEEAQGGLSSSQNATRTFDNFGPLGKHVSGDDFDPTSIKRRPTTVYVCLPSDYIVTHAPWANLVFSTLIEAIGRDRSHARVTLLLDELANLGYMPNLLKAMALYRAQGIRVHGYIQQASQIHRLYGPHGWRDLVGMCDFVQAFGVTEFETCKLLSDMTGQATVEDVSQNLRPSALGGMSAADLSYGQSRTSRVLLTPDEIRTMDSNRQLVIYRNMPALVADKIDYRNRPHLRAAARPNPYYERAKPKS